MFELSLQRLQNEVLYSYAYWDLIQFLLKLMNPCPHTSVEIGSGGLFVIVSNKATDKNTAMWRAKDTCNSNTCSPAVFPY